MPRSFSRHVPNQLLGPAPPLPFFYLGNHCSVFFECLFYCANTRTPATPSLTRYLRPTSVTKTQRLPPFRRAVPTAGASSISSDLPPTAFLRGRHLPRELRPRARRSGRRILPLQRGSLGGLWLGPHPGFFFQQLRLPRR